METLARSLGRIRNACQQATALVSQILTFSRKESGQVATPAALGPIVHEAVGLLRGTPPACVTITMRKGALTPVVVVSPTEIHQFIIQAPQGPLRAVRGA